MKRTLLTAVVAFVCVGLLAGDAYSGRSRVEPADEVAIVVAPKVLSPAADGDCVTIHTNIPFGVGKEIFDSFALNDVVYPTSCKSDSRGFTVLKFDREVVEEVLSPGVNTLTLTGTFEDGTTFTATDTIIVKE